MGATDLLAWKSGYKIGIEEIDLQHHYLLALISKLNAAFQRSCRDTTTGQRWG